MHMVVNLRGKKPTKSVIFLIMFNKTPPYDINHKSKLSYICFSFES